MPDRSIGSCRSDRYSDGPKRQSGHRVLRSFRKLPGVVRQSSRFGSKSRQQVGTPSFARASLERREARERERERDRLKGTLLDGLVCFADSSVFGTQREHPQGPKKAHCGPQKILDRLKATLATTMFWMRESRSRSQNPLA